MVLRPIGLLNGRFCSRQGILRQVGAVGTHVGNLSRLVEFLGYLHGLCYRKIQFAGSLLLKCGGSKWGCRALFGGLFL